MRGYKIVAVLWEDHITRIGAEIPENPDEVIQTPTLTVGILLRETDKSLLIAHDIEDFETGTYSVIIKNAIIGRKNYGKIKLQNPVKGG